MGGACPWVDEGYSNKIGGQKRPRRDVGRKTPRKWPKTGEEFNRSAPQASLLGEKGRGSVR